MGGKGSTNKVNGSQARKTAQRRGQRRAGAATREQRPGRRRKTREQRRAEPPSTQGSFQGPSQGRHWGWGSHQSHPKPLGSSCPFSQFTTSGLQKGPGARAHMHTHARAPTQRQSGRRLAGNKTQRTSEGGKVSLGLVN